MRQHLSCITYQRRKQFIFDRREMDLGIRYENSSGRQVTLRSPHSKDVFPASSPARLACRSATRTRARSSPGTKRLGEIVICAIIQCSNLFLVLVARRKDDDRCGQPFAQSPDDFLAIHIRKAKVENHEIGRKLRRVLKRLLGGARLVELIVRRSLMRHLRTSESVARLRPTVRVVTWRSSVIHLQKWQSTSASIRGGVSVARQD